MKRLKKKKKKFEKQTHDLPGLKSCARNRARVQHDLSQNRLLARLRVEPALFFASKLTYLYHKLIASTLEKPTYGVWDEEIGDEEKALENNEYAFRFRVEHSELRV